MDKLIRVCKATNARSNAEIRIELDLPEMKTLEEAARYYAGQVEMIEQTLYYYLPGGTYDRLLGAMLARKSSHFVVSHGAFKEGV